MTDVIEVRFTQTETWAAARAAEEWCRERGVSYGPSDRTNTRALMVGDWHIAKWHNLSPKERRESHGTITGDHRNGPLTLRIRADMLATRPPEDTER